MSGWFSSWFGSPAAGSPENEATHVSHVPSDEPTTQSPTQSPTATHSPVATQKRTPRVDLRSMAKKVDSDFDVDAEFAKIKAREASANAKSNFGRADDEDTDTDDIVTTDTKEWTPPPFNAYPPQNEAFISLPPMGTRVHVHGLKNKPQLNGQTGTVTRHMKDKGRCGIMLDGSQKQVSLNPSNVKKADEKKEPLKLKPERNNVDTETIECNGADVPAPINLKLTSNKLGTVSFEWEAPKQSPPLFKFMVEIERNIVEEALESWKKIQISDECKCCLTDKNDVPTPLSKFRFRVCSIRQDMSARSDWTTSKCFYAVQPCGNASNGLMAYGPNKSYSFTQTLEEIEIKFIVNDPDGTACAKQFRCEIHPARICFQKQGTDATATTNIISGTLQDAVEQEDSYWEFHAARQPDEAPHILITLYKKAPEWAMIGLTSPSQFWPCIIKEHPQIDADELIKNVPQENKAGSEGQKPMVQRRPYGREAERAGHSPYGMDCNASPDHPYDGYQRS